MKLEDVFLIAPPAGVIAGLTSHFAFDTSLSTSIQIAASVGLLPTALMAVAIVVLILLHGGLNNDRPPCSCGQCTSNEYVYDDAITRQRNAESDGNNPYDFCYSCPKCGTQWLSREDTYYRFDGDGLTPYRRKNRWGRWVSID